MKRDFLVLYTYNTGRTVHRAGSLRARTQGQNEQPGAMGGRRVGVSPHSVGGCDWLV